MTDPVITDAPRRVILAEIAGFLEDTAATLRREAQGLIGGQHNRMLAEADDCDRWRAVLVAASPSPSEIARIIDPEPDVWSGDKMPFNEAMRRRADAHAKADAILSLGLPAPAPAPVSSEGFVLVPVEPTPEMMMAYAKSISPTAIGYSSTIAGNAYRAMIATAPSPDQPSEEIEN